MRRLKRGRLLKLIAVLAALILIALVVLRALWLSPYSLYWAYTLARQGYIKGHPEYCEHALTDDRHVRLAYTPYAIPKPVNGHQLDPNDWEDEDLAKDIMPMSAIIIPLVDYEVTQDAGITWNRFWRYENGGNYYPGCSSFDSLNADNFCVWTHSQFAITHDGGKNWLIHDSNYAIIQDYADCMGINKSL
ncbi:MAG: hypothetical protein ABI690_15375 [Chloroflexota bacterium]